MLAIIEALEHVLLQMDAANFNKPLVRRMSLQLMASKFFWDPDE